MTETLNSIRKIISGILVTGVLFWAILEILPQILAGEFLPSECLTENYNLSNCYLSVLKQNTLFFVATVLALLIYPLYSKKSDSISRSQRTSVELAPIEETLTSEPRLTSFKNESSEQKETKTETIKSFTTENKLIDNSIQPEKTENPSINENFFKDPINKTENKSPPISTQKEEAKSSLVLSKFPKAAISIEFRDEMARAWKEIQTLNQDCIIEFLETLEKEPEIAVEKILQSIEQKVRPPENLFDNEILNAAYSELKLKNPLAAEEFILVVNTLGESVKLEETITKIRSKYRI